MTKCRICGKYVSIEYTIGNILKAPVIICEDCYYAFLDRGEGEE